MGTHNAESCSAWTESEKGNYSGKHCCIPNCLKLCRELCLCQCHRSIMHDLLADLQWHCIVGCVVAPQVCVSPLCWARHCCWRNDFLGHHNGLGPQSGKVCPCFSTTVNPAAAHVVQVQVSWSGDTYGGHDYDRGLPFSSIVDCIGCTCIYCHILADWVRYLHLRGTRDRRVVSVSTPKLSQAWPAINKRVIL